MYKTSRKIHFPQYQTWTSRTRNYQLFSWPRWEYWTNFTQQHAAQYSTRFLHALASLGSQIPHYQFQDQSHRSLSSSIQTITQYYFRFAPCSKLPSWHHHTSSKTIFWISSHPQLTYYYQIRWATWVSQKVLTLSYQKVIMKPEC